MKHKRFSRRFLPVIAALLVMGGAGIGMSLVINMFMRAEPLRKSGRTIHVVAVATPANRGNAPEPEIKQDKVKIAEAVTLDQPPNEAGEPPAAGVPGRDAERGSGLGRLRFDRP